MAFAQVGAGSGSSRQQTFVRSRTRPSKVGEVMAVRPTAALPPIQFPASRSLCWSDGYFRLFESFSNVKGGFLVRAPSEVRGLKDFGYPIPVLPRPTANNHVVLANSWGLPANDAAWVGRRMVGQGRSTTVGTLHAADGRPRESRLGGDSPCRGPPQLLVDVYSAFITRRCRPCPLLRAIGGCAPVR